MSDLMNELRSRNNALTSFVQVVAGGCIAVMLAAIPFTIIAFAVVWKLYSNWEGQP